MTEPTTLPSLPFERPGLLEMRPLARELRERAPITRVRTPVGDQAWLVTRYAEVKQLYDDERLGRSHPDPENAPRIHDSVLIGGPRGNFETEPVDHVQMRALLTPFFTTKRMRALQPRVEAQATELLDAMEASKPPADLHTAISEPLPVLVICELLGVPLSHRKQFRAWSQEISTLNDPQRAWAAMGALNAYMRDLVPRKRANPQEDVISGLAQVAGGAMPEQRVVELASVLLFAGHETTMDRLDLGVTMLLTNPDQWRGLVEDPSRVNPTVEEILRRAQMSGFGLTRYAREDMEVAGVTIRKGDALLLDIGAANMDPRAFEDPEGFDTTRKPNVHLGFGHGAWFCIGAPLARMELRVVLSNLARRFPNLELAKPVEELPVRGDLLVGTLSELPVTW